MTRGSGGLLDEIRATLDGMSLYAAYFVPNQMDPFGLARSCENTKDLNTVDLPVQPMPKPLLKTTEFATGCLLKCTEHYERECDYIVTTVTTADGKTVTTTTKTCTEWELVSITCGNVECVGDSGPGAGGPPGRSRLDFPVSGLTRTQCEWICRSIGFTLTTSCKLEVAFFAYGRLKLRGMELGAIGVGVTVGELCTVLFGPRINDCLNACRSLPNK